VLQPNCDTASMIVSVVCCATRHQNRPYCTSIPQLTLASVGQEPDVALWDIRSPDTVGFIRAAHMGSPIQAVAASAADATLIATGMLFSWPPKRSVAYSDFILVADPEVHFKANL
jgi:hypothetical protein